MSKFTLNLPTQMQSLTLHSVLQTHQYGQLQLIKIPFTRTQFFLTIPKI